MKKRKVGIKDIAELACVSKGTVDRVIHKRGDVSPDAKQRVLDAIEELNYTPNKFASILASNRTYRIATLLTDPKQDEFWQQPHKGLERTAKIIKDYGVYVDQYHFNDADPTSFKILANEILQGNYDGVLFSPSYAKESRDFMQKCSESNLPYLIINSYIESNDPMFVSYIGQDSYGSGVLAGKLLHFGMQKNSKVLMLHLENEVLNAVHLVAKEKGFKDFFKEHMPGQDVVVSGSYGEFDNTKNLKEYLQNLFNKEGSISGIFVTTSKVHQIIPILEELGLSDSIKTVGFDLIESNLEYLKSEKIDFLINQNAYKQGALGLMTLFNYIVLNKESKSNQFLPLDVVMKENVNYYLQIELELVNI